MGKTSNRKTKGKSKGGNNYRGYSSLSICQRDGRESSRKTGRGGLCGGPISIFKVSFSGQEAFFLSSGKKGSHRFPGRRSLSCCNSRQTPEATCGSLYPETEMEEVFQEVYGAQ